VTATRSEPAAPPRGAEVALRRWRPMAYVVGSMLLVLVLVAMPLKYLGDDERAVAVVSPIHGALYILYVLATLDLGRRLRWPAVRMVLVMLAGTVPFVSFLAERRVTADVRARLSGR
jgi:integral membrane protein